MGVRLIEVRLSPSRVEKYLECPARWAFAELEGPQEPDTEATLLGTAVHAAHESYYVRRTPYDTTTRAGYIASYMSTKLPPVLPEGGAVEHELTYDAGGGIVLVGRLDLIWPDDRGYVVVPDHKTTKSLRYAKLERDALFGHAQAPLYVLMGMRKHGMQRARTRWVYGTTDTTYGDVPQYWRPPMLAVSQHDITLDEATERVHLRMLPAAHDMLAIARAGTPARELPKNLTACNAYNRPCPYFKRCQPQKAEQMESAFLNALGAANNAAPAPATAPAPTPVPDAPPAGGLFGGAPPPAAPAAPAGGLFGGAAPATTPAPAAAAPPTTAAAPPAGGLFGAPPADAAPPAVDPATNPPEGDAGGGKGKGKGRKAAGEKGGSPLLADEATIAALADAIVDRLALRLMGGVK